ncbi:hypothetical protein Tco_1438264 [Tanacetum coccineum]
MTSTTTLGSQDEIKGPSSSTSTSQNLSFLSSENTSSTNEVSTASRDFGVSTAEGINTDVEVGDTRLIFEQSTTHHHLSLDKGYELLQHNTSIYRGGTRVTSSEESDNVGGGYMRVISRLGQVDERMHSWVRLVIWGTGGKELLMGGVVVTRGAGRRLVWDTGTGVDADQGVGVGRDCGVSGEFTRCTEFAGLQVMSEVKGGGYGILGLLSCEVCAEWFFIVVMSRWEGKGMGGCEWDRTDSIVSTHIGSIFCRGARGVLGAHSSHIDDSRGSMMDIFRISTSAERQREREEVAVFSVDGLECRDRELCVEQGQGRQRDITVGSVINGISVQEVYKHYIDEERKILSRELLLELGGRVICCKRAAVRLWTRGTEYELVEEGTLLLVRTSFIIVGSCSIINEQRSASTIGWAMRGYLEREWRIKETLYQDELEWWDGEDLHGDCRHDFGLECRRSSVFEVQRDCEQLSGRWVKKGGRLYRERRSCRTLLGGDRGDVCRDLGVRHTSSKMGGMHEPTRRQGTENGSRGYPEGVIVIEFTLGEVTSSRMSGDTLSTEEMAGTSDSLCGHTTCIMIRDCNNIDVEVYTYLWSQFDLSESRISRHSDMGDEDFLVLYVVEELTVMYDLLREDFLLSYLYLSHMGSVNRQGVRQYRGSVGEESRLGDNSLSTSQYLDVEYLRRSLYAGETHLLRRIGSLRVHLVMSEMPDWLRKIMVVALDMYGVMRDIASCTLGMTLMAVLLALIEDYRDCTEGGGSAGYAQYRSVEETLTAERHSLNVYLGGLNWQRRLTETLCHSGLSHIEVWVGTDDEYADVTHLSEDTQWEGGWGRGCGAGLVDDESGSEIGRASSLYLRSGRRRDRRIIGVYRVWIYRGGSQLYTHGVLVYNSMNSKERVANSTKSHSEDVGVITIVFSDGVLECHNIAFWTVLAVQVEDSVLYAETWWDSHVVMSLSLGHTQRGLSVLLEGVGGVVRVRCRESVWVVELVVTRTPTPHRRLGLCTRFRAHTDGFRQVSHTLGEGSVERVREGGDDTEFFWLGRYHYLSRVESIGGETQCGGWWWNLNMDCLEFVVSHDGTLLVAGECGSGDGAGLWAHQTPMGRDELCEGDRDDDVYVDKTHKRSMNVLYFDERDKRESCEEENSERDTDVDGLYLCGEDTRCYVRLGSVRESLLKWFLGTHILVCGRTRSVEIDLDGLERVTWRWRWVSSGLLFSGGGTEEVGVGIWTVVRDKVLSDDCVGITHVLTQLLVADSSGSYVWSQHWGCDSGSQRDVTSSGGVDDTLIWWDRDGWCEVGERGGDDRDVRAVRFLGDTSRSVTIHEWLGSNLCDGGTRRTDRMLDVMGHRDWGHRF